MNQSARVEDLFDPRTRQAALNELPDGDLLIAAVLCNAEPIYPGQDEINTANELAELVLHTRTEGSLSQVLTESLKVVRPSHVLAGIVKLSGYDGSQSDKAAQIAFLRYLPRGRHICDTFLEAMKPTPHTSRDIEELRLLLSPATDELDLAQH
jgi:hypothetical protein